MTKSDQNDIFGDFGPRMLHIAFKNDENSKNVDFLRVWPFQKILSFLKAIRSILGPKSREMSGMLFFWKLQIFWSIWSAICSNLRRSEKFFFFLVKKMKKRGPRLLRIMFEIDFGLTEELF